MENITSKEIAIVGGGPGGLTLARLLQMNGVTVKVYERDEHKDARPKGATLDLHHGSGLKALGAAALMDAFNANYRPGADKMRIVNKHADIMMEDNEEKTGALARPEIDRGPLQRILLESLYPETVVWNSQLVELLSQNGAWELKFKNGTSAFADIVVAADGANSRVRSYITSIKPFYTGVTAVEGAVHHSATESPNIHQLLNGGKIFAMGDGKTLIVSSKGDGSLVFYTGTKTNEDWSKTCGINFSDKTQVLDWFKKEFAGWGEIWQEMFENAYGTFIPRPQYCMPLDQRWEALPNLTMLGDAAHLMPPYAGEGVNMAMLDALELSQCLLSTVYPTLQSAIAAYEKQMCVRASETAKETLDATAALHSADAIAFLVDVIS